MKITITFDELDLKDNLVINTINNLFNQNKAITGNIEEKPINDTSFENNDFVEDVTKQKKEVNDTDKEVQKLKDFANSIYKQLNEKSQKSLAKFVEFYTDKIVNNGFRINPKNNWEKWIERDRNLK